MAYVLETRQGEARQMVGIFGDEAGIVGFIENFPAARRTPDGSYELDFERLPELAEVTFNGWTYVVSRSTYAEGGEEIEFIWTQVCDFDKQVGPGEGPHYAPGWLHLDGYVMPMSEAPEHIRQRERLFAEACSYADSHGLQATREALGSQDGEYVRFTGQGRDGSIAFLLDPMTLQWRTESSTFEDFLQSLPQRYRDL